MLVVRNVQCHTALTTKLGGSRKWEGELRGAAGTHRFSFSSDQPTVVGDAREGKVE
jgi:hypothetical protein